MTDKAWRLDRLGAMADEWIAEREMFLSSMQAYLHNHLQHFHVPPSGAEPLPDDAYAAEIAAIGDRLCQFARALDGIPWYQLRSRERLAAFRQSTDTTFGPPAMADAQRMAELTPPAWAAGAHHALRRGIGLQHHLLQVLRDTSGQFDMGVLLFFRRLVSQIKYLMYPVRHPIPAWQRYWLLDEANTVACEPAEAHADSGIHRYEIDGHRGAYSAYIPEYYQPERPWPLILSMHGGSGNDEDFLWTWLKYAKSRGYLLISAKSFGPTWHAWDIDSVLLILDDMQARYHVDTHRVLLTGLSDGGSFGYEVGFMHPTRFAALAVVAGILRPHHRDPKASELPVYIAHGERDQLFPVSFIRAVQRNLSEWGHDVKYHEIPDFGHAYPAGENGVILDWFEAHTTSA
jgi:phospholipase/carboxylesterase